MMKNNNDRAAKRSYVRFGRLCVINRYLKPDGFWMVEDVFYILGSVVLLFGFAAWIFNTISPENFQKILLPCPVHLFTGLYCPGCGGTRALRYLLHGDLKNSVLYHLAVPYMAVLGGWFMVSQTLWRCSRNRGRHRKSHFWHIRPMQYRNIYLYILAALYLINFLWKNIALLVFQIRVIA